MLELDPTPIIILLAIVGFIYICAALLISIIKKD